MKKSVIFSGIQPTGNLHVGNYLGAVKNWVDLQNSKKYDCYFCIVDYHSLTGNMDAKTRRNQTLHTAAELLAAGIDPEKCTLFVQSHVPEHTELGWIFSTLTPIAELGRMTQFKDKSSRQEKNINTGLFTYPILQAADILLYHGTVVPVGEDQIQHIELTRDIARWFNKKYQNYFPETKHILTEAPRIMSLLEPEKKMSKSLGAGHVIELCDTPDVIEKKIKKAVTATVGGHDAPGGQNLLTLLKHFGGAEAYGRFADEEKRHIIQYGALKQEVAAAIVAHFAAFREHREELLSHPKELHKILDMGATSAREVAADTMERVRALVGVR